MAYAPTGQSNPRNAGDGVLGVNMKLDDSVSHSSCILIQCNLGHKDLSFFALKEKEKMAS